MLRAPVIVGVLLGSAACGVAGTGRLSRSADAGLTASGPPDAGAGTDSGVEVPSVTEVCNFRDDDGDGRVDQGFDWVVDPWSGLHSTIYSPRWVQAVLLASGRAGVMVAEESRSSFIAELLILPASGPYENMAQGQVIDLHGRGTAAAYSITEGPRGEIGAALGTGDQALFVRVNAEGVQKDGPVTYAGLFLPRITADLEWTPSGYVLATVDTLGLAHLSWLTDIGGIDRDVVLLGEDTSSMATQATPSGLAWVRARSSLPLSVEYGLYSLDGTRELLAPTLISDAQGANIKTYRSGRNILSLGDDLAILYDQLHRGVDTPKLVVTSTDGAILKGPMGLTEPTDLDPLDMTIVDGNIVVLSLGTHPEISGPGAHTATLHRVDRSLELVPAPSGPSSFAGSPFMSLVSTGAEILVLMGNGEGTTLQFTRVHCP